MTTESGDGSPHTAPHDEIINVVHELLQRAHVRPVTIDSLANALKARGFSRTPGSPRLITRLRRIKEISLNRSGVITLVQDAAPSEPEVLVTEEIAVPIEVEATPVVDADAQPAERGDRPQHGPRRRRSRRGGRRRRSAQPSPATASAES